MSELRHDPLSELDVIVAAGPRRPPGHLHVLGPRRCRCRPLPVLSRVRGRDPAGAGPHRSRRTRDPGLARAGVSEHVPDRRRRRGRQRARRARGRGALARPRARSPSSTTSHAAEVAAMLRDRVRTHLDAGYPYAFATINHLPAAGASMVAPARPGLRPRLRARRQSSGRWRASPPPAPTSCSWTPRPRTWSSTVVAR